ncbi:MAG: hypothetical protein Q4G05_05145 [Clostridia bacterium]|nr:hypothetical protein [Clostridia bacterium]
MGAKNNRQNNKKIRGKIKNEKFKGITLIALVITIVVMLILAGIAINLSLGDNGIFLKAKDSKIKTELASMKEKVELERASVDLSMLSISNFDGTLPTGNFSNIIPEKWADSFIVGTDGTLTFIGESGSELEEQVDAIGGIEKINAGNKVLLGEIKKLSELAIDYKAEHSGESNADAVELALEYLRIKRYTTPEWGFFTRASTSPFKDTVGTQVNIDSNAMWVDPITGENIDLIHMMATLNAYKFPTIFDDQDDTTGWAGDLTTLAKQVEEDNPDTTEVKAHTNSLLAAGVESSFGLADMLADIDSRNIRELWEGEDSLYNVILNYYYGTNRNVCSARYSSFNSEYENVGEHAESMVDWMLASTGDAINEELKDIVIQCFVDYINNNLEIK